MTVICEALDNHLKDIGRSASVSAVGSVVSDIAEGERDVATIARHAVGAAAGGAVREVAGRGLESAVTKVAAKAGAGVAKKAAKGVAKSAAKTVGKEISKRGAGAAARTALRSNALSSIAFLCVDQAADTARFAAGSIDGDEYRARTGENVGGAVGSLGGSALGAAIGSALFPGVGTAVGALIGGCFGGMGGGLAGRSIAE
jgi:hypothetical protein